VLFVCVGNQGRSVMAERLFRRAAAGRHQARSAGSNPGTSVPPQVLEALAEIVWVPQTRSAVSAAVRR